MLVMVLVMVFECPCMICSAVCNVSILSRVLYLLRAHPVAICRAVLL